MDTEQKLQKVFFHLKRGQKNEQKKNVYLTAGAENNQNLRHTGSPICAVGAEIAGLNEKKIKTTAGTHAASEKGEQRVANQQEIVFFQPNIGPPLDCSSNQRKWSTTV